MTSTASKTTKNNSNDTSRNSDIRINNQSIDQQNKTKIAYPNYYDSIFETFKQNMQNVTNLLEQSWPTSTSFPSFRSMTPFDFLDRMTDTKLPLCDVIDRGDKYEINFEIPGINKEKIDIRATKYSVSVSASQSEKTKEQGKKYVYSERSLKSFKRQIPFAEEILPSQIKAKVTDGVLEIDVPKKNPTSLPEGDGVKIDIS